MRNWLSSLTQGEAASALLPERPQSLALRPVGTVKRKDLIVGKAAFLSAERRGAALRRFLLQKKIRRTGTIER
jgi:hypothetical protein